MEGVVRLTLLDPQDRPVRTLFEARSETLRTSLTNRTQQIPLPEHEALVGEDWSFALEVRADAALMTLDFGDTDIYIDMTNYSVRGA